MNKNLLLAVAALIVLGGVGLVGVKLAKENRTDTDDMVYVAPSTMTTTTASETTTPVVNLALNSKTVDLAEQNDSEESGSVMLTEENGKVIVTINVEGEPNAAIQPAHIHAGSCPTPGAVKYPLMNVVEGKSVTTLNVSLDQLKAQMPLAINLHESNAKISNYVACGDLKL